jgi:hypothetical protein
MRRKRFMAAGIPVRGDQQTAASGCERRVNALLLADAHRHDRQGSRLTGEVGYAPGCGADFFTQVVQRVLSGVLSERGRVGRNPQVAPVNPCNGPVSGFRTSHVSTSEVTR